MIDDTTTTNKDRSILLTFLCLYQREIDSPTAVKHLFKALVPNYLINRPKILFEFLLFQLRDKTNLFECSDSPLCNGYHHIRQSNHHGCTKRNAEINRSKLHDGDPRIDLFNDVFNGKSPLFDRHFLNIDLFSHSIQNKISEVYSYTMNAVHVYPWLTWSWILACIAQIQRGKASGVLEILEGLCRSNFFTMDDVCHLSIVFQSSSIFNLQKMIILIAKTLHSLGSKQNDRILYLFQVLIMHRPGKNLLFFSSIYLFLFEYLQL